MTDKGSSVSESVPSLSETSPVAVSGVGAAHPNGHRKNGRPSSSQFGSAKNGHTEVKKPDKERPRYSPVFLGEEFERYEAMEEDLIRNHPGEFIVLKGQHPPSFHPTFEAATHYGYTTYGYVHMLIHEVKKEIRGESL